MSLWELVNMAIVIKRGNKLHIQWYDPIKEKTNSRSTNLVDNAANRKEAMRLAKELQKKLTQGNEERHKYGFSKATLQEAFNHFLENNQTKNPKTIKDYYRFFRKFTETFESSEPCTSLNKLEVERWFNEIKKLPLSKNTIHGYGKQCIHFLNFLFEYSYVPMFKINHEVKTKPEEKEKIIIRDEDLIKIFNGLDAMDPKGNPIKNNNFKTLIYLLFYTGLRESDVLTITVEKIDLENREMNYFMQKGKKHRHIHFHEDLVPILKSRIEEVKEGKILNYNNIENIGQAVRKYFDKLGIRGKGYMAKSFRKTFITLCRNRFHIDASIVKELVGHSPGNVTDRYYNLIDIETMKNELKKFTRPIEKDWL